MAQCWREITGFDGSSCRRKNYRDLLSAYLPARPKRENVEFFANHLTLSERATDLVFGVDPKALPFARMDWKIGGCSAAVKMLHHRNAIDFDEDKFAELSV